MKPETQTPRVDECVLKYESSSLLYQFQKVAGFARQLERELTTATERAERLERALRVESEARRNVLVQKSDELRREWIRAEQAEAALLAYQQGAVRVCDESKLYDTADALHNLSITPQAERIGKVLGAVEKYLEYRSSENIVALLKAFREYREGNESEQTT